MTEKAGALPPRPSPGAVKLATALSVATRIEAELIRAVRLTVFPELDVGAESDLWFSDWVGARIPGGIVLLPEVLPVLRAGLRQMLQADPTPRNPVSRVWSVISAMHRDISPALLLEERLTWLALTDAEGNRGEIEEELRTALLALVRDGRTGLADWTRRAWSRLPAEVLATTTAWQLGAVSARYTDLGARAAVPPSLRVADVAAVARELEDVPLSVRREAKAVLFGDVGGPDAVAILVPDSDPVVVDVESDQQHRRTVRIPKGQVVRVEITGEVSVYTPRGDRYIIPEREPESRLASETGRPEAGGTIPIALEHSLTPLDPLGWIAAVPDASEKESIDAAIRLLNEEPAPTVAELMFGARVLVDRFLLEGDVSDLAAAVDTYRRALAAADPPGAELLAEAASALHDQFLTTGDTDALAEAQALARRAAAIEGDPSALLILSAVNFSTYQRTGDMSALHEAIGVSRSALARIPQSDPAYPIGLARTAELLTARYYKTGGAEAIEEAIEFLTRAIDLATQEHSEFGAMLNNLASSLLIRFGLRGDPGDLDRSVDLYRRSAALVPADGPQRPMILATLANALRTRFEFLGDRFDLDGAVASAIQAIDLIPQDHFARPSVLSIFATTLLARFTYGGMLPDLEQAISVLTEADAALPPDHYDRTATNANLANALRLRFERAGDLTDLERAIAAAEQAVAGSAMNSPVRTTAQAALAEALFVRYEWTGGADSLARAIEVARSALAGVINENQDRPSLLVSLALILRAQYQAGVTGSLFEAISLAKQADSAVQADTPVSALAASCLADLLGDHYALEHATSDAISALELWRSAAANPAAAAQVRLNAAISWADIAGELGDWPEALSGYESALELLPSVWWPGATAGERAIILGRYANLGQDAAACALMNGFPERAFELLERGRGQYWDYALSAPAGLTNLRAAAPDLAERLDQVRTLLDAAARTAGATAAPSATRLPQERTAYRLATEWTDLVRSVRAIPGFESFLRGPSFSELTEAAKDGPVVVVNTSRLRCDAFLLTRYGLTVIQLDTSFDEVARQAERYSRFWADDIRQEILEQGEITLRWLWEKITRPVFSGLGLLREDAGEPLPRLWWCPTGPLASLPLHFARYSPEESRPESSMRYARSSYTPTMQALIAARTSPANPADGGMLLVGDILVVPGPSTFPGIHQLPGTRQELRLITSLLEQTPTEVLSGDSATRAAVLERLSRRSSLHFGGHAIATPDLATSGLLLSDGILTVTDLADLRLLSGDLAYLSACNTARSVGPLPDGLTLASALHIAGYRNVIAVLGELPDYLAARLSDLFYRYLVDSRGRIRPELSADALHRALLDLTERYPERYVLISGVIHIGP